MEYKALVSACSDILHTYPLADKAASYLNNRLNFQTQKKFQFGYFPPQNQLQILFSYFEIEELLDFGIIYEDKLNVGDNQRVFLSQLQDHNLILPYKDVYGNVIALVGRSILEEEDRKNIGIAKYKNTSFKKSKHLFGLNEARNSILELGYTYVVEGQFDCIQAHNHNITNIVALGSSNMSLEQLCLLLRYTNHIKLLLDNDEAGESGRNRIMEKFGKYTDISNVYVPQGFKDLDEFLAESSVNSERDLLYTLNK